MESVNPFNGGIVARYEEMDRDTVNAAIQAAHQAHLGWRERSFAERAQPMKQAAELLRDRAQEYGRLMALEMGKPVCDGVGEAKKCGIGCDFYAAEAERFLAPQPVELEGRKAKVVFRPLGVLLAVMPWN